jgi:hypothetical protein
MKVSNHSILFELKSSIININNYLDNYSSNIYFED